jgi:hypothetical protein
MVNRLWSWLAGWISAVTEYIKNKDDVNNDPFSDNPCVIL